jgi:hypothetical protein
VNASCRRPDPAGSVLAPAVELVLDGVVAVWLAGVVSEEPVAVDGLGLGELECVGVGDFD